MIGKDVNLVSPASELLGDPLDADRGSTRGWKGTCRNDCDPEASTYLVITKAGPFVGRVRRRGIRRCILLIHRACRENLARIEH